MLACWELDLLDAVRGINLPSLGSLAHPNRRIKQNLTGRGHLLQKKYFGKEENTTATQQMLQQVKEGGII